MRKRSLILIPLMAVLIAAFGLLLLDQQKDPAWQVKLNQYINFVREMETATPRVISSTPASFPANFTPDMSSETYSTSVIFQTNQSQGLDYVAGLLPLPYPPEEVMCVLLDVGGQNQMVYVALHNTLYNADWIVHISPESWGSPALQSHLSSLGCSLKT